MSSTREPPSPSIRKSYMDTSYALLAHSCVLQNCSLGGSVCLHSLELDAADSMELS